MIWKKILPPLIALSFLLLAWELAFRVYGFSPLILPDPREVMITLWNKSSSISSHAIVTLQRTTIGLALGTVIGIFLGLIIGYSAAIYSAIYPILTAFYCIPKQAFVPIFVVWAGFGTLPAIITATTTAFFPVLVNVATGVSTINPDLADLIKSFGGNKRQIFLKIGIPNSLPYFFSSLRIAGMGALIGVVVSEMIAAREGVGYMVVMAATELRTPLLFSYVIVSALMGILIYTILTLTDRRMARWAYRGKNT